MGHPAAVRAKSPANPGGTGLANPSGVNLRTSLLALVPVAFASLAACTISSSPSVDGVMTAGLSWNVDSSIVFRVQVKVDGTLQTDRIVAASAAKKSVELSVDPKANPNAEIEIKVEGENGQAPKDGSYPVISRVVRTHFVPGRSTLVPIFMDQRCILSIGDPSSTFCSGGLQCAGSTCVSPDVDPKTLPDYRPDWSVDELCGAADAKPELVVAAHDGPIQDGDVLPMVSGGQGGSHVYLDFTVKGLHQKSSSIRVRAVDVGGSTYQPSSTFNEVLDRDAPTGSCVLHSARWVVDPGGMYGMVSGHTFDVTFEATDFAGGKVTVTKRIKL